MASKALNILMIPSKIRGTVEIQCAWLLRSIACANQLMASAHPHSPPPQTWGLSSFPHPIVTFCFAQQFVLHNVHVNGFWAHAKWNENKNKNKNWGGGREWCRVGQSLDKSINISLEDKIFLSGISKPGVSLYFSRSHTFFFHSDRALCRPRT